MSVTHRDAMTRVLDALRTKGCRVLTSGPNKARAQCPNHRDLRPSLCIDRKGPNVLLKDFGGCSTKTVLDALGLTWTDLREGPAPLHVTGPSHVVATYVYSDSHGTPYAQKVRLGPVKSFRWERRDDTAPSGWRRRLDGLKPLLYGLEHVVEARRVVIVEGEKAVDRLRECGVIAVCPPVGANVWSDGWSELLWRCGAAEVVVIADADQAGRDHAARVAASCATCRPTLAAAVEDDPWPDVTLQEGDTVAAPLTVRLVEPPGLDTHQDIYDWLLTHSRADLEALLRSTPLWTPVDPVTHRRALGAARVRKHRAKKADAMNTAADVTRERSTEPDKQRSSSVESPAPVEKDLSQRYALQAGADVITSSGGVTTGIRRGAHVGRDRRRVANGGARLGTPDLRERAVVWRGV